MKRLDLIRHSEKHGCEFLREGRNHTIYVNRAARKVSSVPRHRDIIEFTAWKILPRPGNTPPLSKAAEWEGQSQARTKRGN